MKNYITIGIEISVPNDIIRFKEFLEYSSELTDQLKLSYVAVRDLTNGHSRCIIDDILIDDLMKYPEEHPIRQMYDQYICRYGKDSLDNWIVTKDKMKSKFMNLCEKFINIYLFKDMDVDEVIVSIPKRGSDGFESDIGNILYEVIQENFNIVKQNLSCNNNSIHITKKRS